MEEQQHKKRSRRSMNAEGSGRRQRQEVEHRGAILQPGGHCATIVTCGAQPRCHGKAGPHGGGDQSSGHHAAQSSGHDGGRHDDASRHGRGDQSRAAMAPSPVVPSSAAMVVYLEPTSPVAIVKPARAVKPEDEVAEQEDAAMAAGAAEDVASLDLRKKLFHCAACLIPLKPPVFKCENEHFVCHACCGGGDGNGDGGTNRHCGPCGRDVSYTRSRFMDGVVDAYKVPCLYKNHGCTMDDISYHSAADTKARCKHAPCFCFDCRFVRLPAKLVRHLAAPSGEHAWPVEKIKYEEPQPFVVPASSEDQRRLLVTEDGRVFLLAVGAGREPGGRRPVTVVCVRGNADADAKPLYTGVLWVDGPPAPPRQPLGASLKLKAMVASCSVPGAVDMEQGWLHAHVNPNMLHGDSGELHLRLCLTKLA